MPRTTELILLLTALAVAGCGSKSETVVRTAKEPGWKVAVTEGDGASMEIPADWKAFDFTSGTKTAVIGEAEANNADMSSLNPQIQAMASSGKIKMYAYHEPSANADTFPPFANVVVEPMPSGIAEEDFIANMKKTMKGVAKGVEPKIGKVQLPAGPAYRMSSEIDFDRPDGGAFKTFSMGYMFLDGGKVTTIIFCGLQADRAKLEPIFDKMAQSIKLK